MLLRLLQTVDTKFYFYTLKLKLTPFVKNNPKYKNLHQVVPTTFTHYITTSTH